MKYEKCESCNEIVLVENDYTARHFPNGSIANPVFCVQHKKEIIEIVTVTHPLRMDDLENSVIAAGIEGAKYIAIGIQMQGFDSTEIIINEAANFETKLAYYKEAYDENLFLKRFKGNRIVSLTFADTFAEIEMCLVKNK